MSHEYEMSVKNQRCPAWMISEFLASVPLINGRVTDTGQSMTRCQKPLPHPPPPLVRNEGLTSEASPERAEREISASTCVRYRYITREYRAARLNRRWKNEMSEGLLYSSGGIVIFIVSRIYK